MTLKVYNDIAAELSMAVLKFLKRTKEPDEEIMYRCVNNDNAMVIMNNNNNNDDDVRCVKSLVKFSVILRADLLSCIAMVGVDLDTIVPGSSERVDALWGQLRQQLLTS